MKTKIDFKQPKYLIPLVLLVPIVFLIYNVTGIFASKPKQSELTVTDSLNTMLPEADARPLGTKGEEIDKSFFSNKDLYTAVMGVDREERQDTASNIYTERELDAIDKYQAELKAEKAAKDAEAKALIEDQKHYNKYTSSVLPDNESEESKETAEYRKMLQRLQNLETENTGLKQTKEEQAKAAKEEKIRKAEEPKVVTKAEQKNAHYFNTVNHKERNDDPLIKAIIDKTTKAKVGTRLRFKLLDDVSVQGTIIPKNSYLYGIVTGFQGQRVNANINSILIKDHFIKVSLTVYDNDGMQGFYVPKSMFRELAKEAASQSMNSNNMNINTNSGTVESAALQTIQQIYQSTTSAISQNLRKDKAKIKYNTIVYLINTNANQ